MRSSAHRRRVLDADLEGLDRSIRLGGPVVIADNAGDDELFALSPNPAA